MKNAVDLDFEEVEEKKTLKDRAKDICEKGKDAVHKGVDWCKENKEAVILFGPVIFGSVIEMIKIMNRRSTVAEEKRLKENYIYDPSHHHYYELKRQPKQSEWCMIDQREDNGENLYDILSDMRLLKR